MQLSEIVSRFVHHPGLVAMAESLHTTPSGGLHHHGTRIEGLRGSAPAVVMAALAQRSGSVQLIVMNDEEEAGYCYNDLTQLLGKAHVLFLPSSYRRAVKYGQRDTAHEILRTDVLTQLSLRAAPPIAAPTPTKQPAASPSATVAPLCIVTYPAALAERVPSAIDLQTHSLPIAVSEEHDVIVLTEQLEDLGFKRRDYVYEPGEYALRGSILDVFSFAADRPYRIDFFGDEIESIRSFEIQSQLSSEAVERLSIVPEMSLQAMGDGLVPITDCFPPDTVLWVRHLQFVVESVQKIYDEGFARQAIAEREATSAMEEAAIFERLSSSSMLCRGDALLAGLKRMPRFELAASPQTDALEAALPTATPPKVGLIQEGETQRILFHTQAQPLYHKNFELLLQDFQRLRGEGKTLYILAESEKQCERLADILTEMQLPPTQKAQDHLNGRSALFIPIHHALHEGFSDATLQLALYTDHQIFDRFHKYQLRTAQARDAKMALSLKELMLFEPGDYVVHVDHGVGRFAGLVRLPSADGTMQEVIKITYHNNDAIFVSIHALHKVSKYKGKEGEAPRLSHLGTGAWERLKDKTKQKLKDIARDLILLYSRRREERGFAFSPDSFMQHELEASFAYEDTPDQLKVTQQVKADMERERPMDRLVCGDVGFGKTEIAVRAACKAVADNKQVAVMVPTTVLALQHYKTFVKRLSNFPVQIDYLSRARSTAQTKAILKDLASGNINIIVGTHKLISKSVKFHDLGLLIIDEEQKFGVGVKEKLRQMKINVDTLTMSATPIPRTLQFSLMGARDLSIINTPPPNRHPIQTEIHSFGHEILSEAINFELSRNGQVYIVTHRISSIANIEHLIRQHVPDARLCVGHGQMPPAELEQLILDFINHEYDVLISTTIIENGIDVPNANTILIDNAHHFGLSDLHQMRGRVGRGGRKAFCYLLAPPLSLLPDDARRRLQAIENFSDLGSGIHIAMQDLDIRGAGNLLGAEQSGFVADLGYETYQKILSEAVSELKSEEFSELFAEELERENATLDASAFVSECNVECDLRAYLPETYIPGTSERMLLYRELDGFTDDEQLTDFRLRLEDRFGALPPEAEELLKVLPLRRLGRQCGAERLVIRANCLTLYFVSHLDSPFYRSAAFARICHFVTLRQNTQRCNLVEQKGKRFLRIQRVSSVAAAVELLSAIVATPISETA